MDVTLTSALVREYTPLVASTVARYRGWFHLVAAEDMIQCVWLSLTHEIPKYDGRVPLRGYIAQRSHWACKRAIYNADPRKLNDNRPLQRAVEVKPYHATQDPWERHEGISDVLTVLGELTPGDREAALRYAQSASHEEFGAKYGKTRQWGRWKRAKLETEMRRIASKGE